MTSLIEHQLHMFMHIRNKLPVFTHIYLCVYLCIYINKLDVELLCI